MFGVKAKADERTVCLFMKLDWLLFYDEIDISIVKSDLQKFKWIMPGISR